MDTTPPVVPDQIECPICHALNAGGSKICNACGQNLDILHREIAFFLEPGFSVLRKRSAQLLIGIGFGAVFTYLVFFLVSLYPGTILHQIFFPPGLQILLIIAIVGLTFWPLGIVLVRLIFVFSDHARFTESIGTNLKEIMTKPVREQNEQVQRNLAAVRPSLNPSLLVRVRILRKALEEHELRAALERRFETENDLEDAEKDGYYSMLHLFIWALPILGFLGTVIGITLAVANFSGFLAGNIEDIDLIKSELGKVTNGLSFAFGTTILGLVGALILMMVTSITQNYENDFVTRIRRFCIEHFVPILPQNDRRA